MKHTLHFHWIIWRKKKKNHTRHRDINLFLFCSLLDNHEKTRRAKQFTKLVLAETESVKKCLQCHINANTKETRSRWFTMVCKVPHLIIWAYKRNARYWPAKVMSIDENVQHINVRFFGGYHKHENVPTRKCFLYSKKSPGNNLIQKSNYRMSLEFKSALMVNGKWLFFLSRTEHLSLVN